MTYDEMNRQLVNVPFVCNDDDGKWCVKCKLSPGTFLIMSNDMPAEFIARKRLKQIREEMRKAWEVTRR